MMDPPDGTAAPYDGARYCPRCATALVMRVDGGRERPACASCGYVAYRNPAPIAIMVAAADDRVLLVRRANEPLRGFWAPPAGYVEVDESVEEAAVREAREETGLDVRVDRLLGVWSSPPVGLVGIAYAGTVAGGRFTPSDEAEDAGLFPRRDLPRQPAMHAGTPRDVWFRSVLDDLLG